MKAFSHTYIIAGLLLFSLPCLAQVLSDEYGSATYYGDEFHGRRTASGKLYDKNALTCAHRTLPFGTKVRVTRLDNKKSVIVEVNDRGPMLDKYVVDLSRKAAEVLGMIQDGVVKVKVEVLEKDAEAPRSNFRGTTEEKPAAASASVPAAASPKPEMSKSETPESKIVAGSPKLVTSKEFQTYGTYQIELKQVAGIGYAVQLITFSNADNVLAEVAKLQKKWGGKVLIHTSPPIPGSENTTYKIMIGSFADEKTAEKNRKIAVKSGYPKAFLVKLDNP